MNYCSACGARVELRVPDGDNMPRFVCVSCGTIHYQNPRVIVGCIPEHDGKLLLCRRAIQPRLGFWTFPAGFMENGESLESGAARECWEEAQARVDIGSLVAVVTVIHAEQVHVMFRARLAEPGYAAGPESLEVALFAPEDSPWKDIAFRSIDFALRRYLEDRAAGVERLHITHFEAPAGHPAPSS
jgi:ADP-ribose pyrophosphatase YjhB (NUDIX family)